MGSNKTIYSKLPKVRLDIFMPWAIRAAVATALIMWSNELEKWWLGGCMAERYSWQLSSAQLSLLSVLGRCMKWDEQYYDRRASWMRNCFLCHGSIISWSLPKSLLTFLESFKNPKESIGNLLENFSRGWPKKNGFYLTDEIKVWMLRVKPYPLLCWFSVSLLLGNLRTHLESLIITGSD